MSLSEAAPPAEQAQEENDPMTYEAFRRLREKMGPGAMSLSNLIFLGNVIALKLHIQFTDRDRESLLSFAQWLQKNKDIAIPFIEKRICIEWARSESIEEDTSSVYSSPVSEVADR